MIPRSFIIFFLALIVPLVNAKEPQGRSYGIVGGMADKEVDDRPPFMVVFNFQPSSSVACSSSMISTQWIVSAAHCIASKKHMMDGSCLSNYTKAKFKAKCEPQNNGDMKIIFPVQAATTPEVIVDIAELNMQKKNMSKKFLVDFIIVHKDGYKGGKYGRYGGHDIILVKTIKPMDKHFRACVPGPNFTPGNTLIGGYGRYRRIQCQVNDQGPHVFQFCKVDENCDAVLKKQAKCEVRFKYNGTDQLGCIREEETPSVKNPDCIDFRNQTATTNKDMTRKNLSEIVIFDAGLQNVLTKCYTTDPGKYGWCGLTIKDKTTNKNKDMDIKYDNGWGHCSDTCIDKEKISNAGKARIKPVTIMDQTYCDQELMRMIRGNSSFTVKPLVYCVAHNETYKTGFYEKLENGTYKELESKAEYHLKLNRSFPWYIRATGSCRGDSGGPLYEQRGNEYILLGTASRGAGSLETCGGIDNPTHYVRMKDMLPWITEYVSKDELCIVN